MMVLSNENLIWGLQMLTFAEKQFKGEICKI